VEDCPKLAKKITLVLLIIFATEIAIFQKTLFRRHDSSSLRHLPWFLSKDKRYGRSKCSVPCHRNQLKGTLCIWATWRWGNCCLNCRRRDICRRWANCQESIARRQWQRRCL